MTSSPVKTIQQTSTGSITAILPQPVALQQHGRYVGVYVTAQGSQGLLRRREPARQESPAISRRSSTQLRSATSAQRLRRQASHPHCRRLLSVVLSGTGAILDRDIVEDRHYLSRHRQSTVFRCVHRDNDGYTGAMQHHCSLLHTHRYRSVLRRYDSSGRSRRVG